MTYELIPELGENILLDVRFQPSSKSTPFHFAVTDRALYVPATKFVISGDPHYFKRVTDDEVKSVSIQDIRPYGAWALAVVLIGLGLVMGLVLMLPGGFTSHPSTFGHSLEFIVGGLLIPFVARGRKRLVVEFYRGKNYQWIPPFVVDGRSKKQVSTIMNNILQTCRTSGKPVVE